jgi:hypothetical protein
MLRPTATSVRAIDPYKIEVKFDTGETGVFDVAPYIKGEWYSELKDPCYFKNVFTNGYTVEWPHGQDLCPDELYYDSIKDRKSRT